MQALEQLGWGVTPNAPTTTMIHGNNGAWDDLHSPTPDVNAPIWGEEENATTARYHKGDN